MGNSESNQSIAQNGNNSNRSVPNRPPVLGSVNGYNYYQNPYVPQQYVYPNYPAYYAYPGYYNAYDPANGYVYYVGGPVVSNADTVGKKMYPKTENKISVPVNGASTAHRTAQQPNNTTHPHSHHHPHSTHSHHHNHPPQQDQIPLTTVQERLSPPIPAERVISRRPSVRQPSTVTITKISSPSIHKEIVSPPPPVQAQNPMPASITPQNASARAPSILMQRPSPSPIVQQNKSAVHSSKATSFEKAPIIETNYVPRSSDNNTIQSYGPDTLSIVRRSGLHPSTTGNRWYDHDYDKRVKPLDVNYLSYE